MARTDNLTNFLTDVAKAIKDKKDDQTAIKASNFDTEITNLPTVSAELQDKSITISENTVTNITPDLGYDGLSSVTVTTNVSGGGTGGLDWQAIGFNNIPSSLVAGYAYAKKILDEWDYSARDLSNKFKEDNNLLYFPSLDLSNSSITKMAYMLSTNSTLVEVGDLTVKFSSAPDISSLFHYCYYLRKIGTINIIYNGSGYANVQYMFHSNRLLETAPELNIPRFQSCTSMFNGCTALKDVPVLPWVGGSSRNQNMFSNCPNLTNQSLDNILQMCINTTVATSPKTLYYMGIKATDYPVSRIEALPHYQDFLDAGWTIGY